MDSGQAKAFAASLQGAEINGWKVSGFYGAGKSAVVLPAVRDGQAAALKVFHPELIERFGRAVQLDRIARETSLVGQSHPHLVQILDGGSCPVTGHLYVAMEPLPFPTLRDVLQQVPLDAVPRIISQVASAARFLEDLNLVHRDIKPENIAVSPDYKRAVLLDLGVVKPVFDENITDVDARRFVGTLRYSSPEFLLRKEKPTQEGGRAITFYQLGAVLHDLIMRRPLFHKLGEPYSELVQAVLNDKPEIYGDDTRSVALAKRCLIKNPDTRVEIVQWSEFIEQPAEVGANLAMLQSKLKARQAAIKADSESAPTYAAEAERLAKQRIEDVANRFVSRVASLLNASDLFPLCTTKSDRDIRDQSCSTLITFEKDADLGLDHHLVLRFVIRMIDENGGDPMYKAMSCWAISDGEVDSTALTALTEFHSGGIDALLDSAELEQQFVGALQAAYDVIDRGTKMAKGGLIPLSGGAKS
jgi:eukaryotic-like serine/threonine-protein kinase